MTGGLTGALVIWLAVIAGLRLARRFAGGLARAGVCVAVLLVIAVAASVAFRG